MIYNTPYSIMMGDKHPKSLGTPLKVVWSEIWETLSPSTEAVLQGNVIETKDGLWISASMGCHIPAPTARYDHNLLSEIFHQTSYT